MPEEDNGAEAKGERGYLRRKGSRLSVVFRGYLRRRHGATGGVRVEVQGVRRYSRCPDEHVSQISNLNTEVDSGK